MLQSAAMRFLQHFRGTTTAFLFFCVFLVPAAAETPSIFSVSDRAPLNWSNSQFQPLLADVDARAAVLMDAQTGSVLYAHNSDEVLPPASIIKLVSMYFLLEEVSEGRLDLHADIPIPVAAWARNAPPRSSLMFLGPGQRASLHDLLLGLAIPSGNDAAVAAALLLADSVDEYVDLANRRLAGMGFEQTRMVEPSGYSRDNTTTAMEMAQFAYLYVNRHPEAISSYHSVRNYGFPLQENLLPGHFENPIYQQNYNRLLWIMPDADGLKTGTTPSAGYNLVSTAERDGRRLIAVVLGVDAPDSRNGNIKRAEVSRDLLEYGFNEFANVELEIPDPGMVRVYGSRVAEIQLYVDAAWASSGTAISLPQNSMDSVTASFQVERRLRGEFQAGTELGRLVFYSNEQEIFSAPLRASDAAEQAPWWIRLRDWLIVLWEQIRGLEKPLEWG